MDPTLLLWLVLAFSWAQHLWELYLSWRQYRTYVRTEKVPPEVSEILDPESFAKSRLYKIERARYGFVHSCWSQVLDTAVLLMGVLPGLWGWSGQFSARPWVQTSVFIAAGTLLSTLIELPWSLYDAFVVEERHGFNKQTLGFFFKDKAKKLVVSLILVIPISNAVVWIVEAGGRYFFLYLWAFVSAVIFVLLTVYPEFIAPLFDKYTPLPEGELRTKIEALASRLSFPLTKLYVVEGSKRSAHSNAYMYGFWKNKRIVLFDTLLAGWGETEEEKKKGMDDDEVLAVLGHELGHWSLSHTLWNLLVMELNQLLVFAAFAALYPRPDVYAAFGFVHSQPTLIGLVIIMQYILAPYNALVNFAVTAWTRRMEFAADAFAAGLGYASELAKALVKLGKDNLSFPVDDPLYSAWNHSHPPIPERVRVLHKTQ